MMTKRPPMTTMLLLLAAGFVPATAIAAPGRAAQGGSGAAAAQADIEKTLGFVPQFFLKFPEEALPGAWDEMKSLQLNPSTALPGKVKELIGPGRRGADPLPLLHLRAHRVRQAQRRERDRDRRGGRDGRPDPPLEHVPERHPDRRVEVPRRDRQHRRERRSAAAKTPPGSPCSDVVDGVDGQTALGDIA